MYTDRWMKCFILTSKVKGYDSFCVERNFISLIRISGLRWKKSWNFSLQIIKKLVTTVLLLKSDNFGKEFLTDCWDWVVYNKMLDRWEGGGGSRM